MDYNEHDIDQMIDEILTDEKTEPMEDRACVRCQRVFQAKAKSTKKYCPECLTAIRQFGGRKSKPGSRSQSAASPAAKPSPTIFSGDPQKQARPAGLTVRRLQELLETVPKPDTVSVLINGSPAASVELRSVWTPERDKENTLYIWEDGHVKICESAED